MIKSGDIVLIKGENLLSFLVKIGNFIGKIFNFEEYESIQYTHVGMMMNDHQIVEALSEGVTLRNFPYTKNYEIYSLTSLTDEERNMLVNSAMKLIGVKYSWFLLIVLAILKVTHTEWLFKGIGHTGQICSRVIGTCYSIIGYSFNGEALDVLDPADIAGHIMNNSEWKLVS